jgi:pyrroloquinoline quinone biosynthesis protein B
MRIKVLGAAAGGGYPQWNCNHPNSRRARSNDPAAQQRTQSSIAVSVDGDHWFLFNASPDLRQQINENDVLHPKEGLRHSPIQGVVLTNADVDHIAGLLNLRESQPLRLYGTNKVLDVLQGNSVFNVLNPKFVERIPLSLDVPLQLQLPNGVATGLVVVPFAVPGKVALWLEEKNKDVALAAVGEDTIALEIRNANQEIQFFYIPGCAEMTDDLADRLRGAPLVFFDGTLWRDDEMIRDDVGVKTGKRMGHMSMSGDDGSIAAFDSLRVKRKVFIHINTTNPVLLEDSDQRKFSTKAGWEVSYDGMEITL